MLAHSENQSSAHGSMPYSSLHQVTSTDEHNDTNLSKHGHLQPSVSDNYSGLTNRFDRKVLKLGIHDGSSAASTALLDLGAFRGTSISRGSPIIIAPAKDADAATEEDYLDAISELASRGSPHSDLCEGRSSHLFVAESMDSQMTVNSPRTQVGIFVTLSYRSHSALIYFRFPSAVATQQNVVSEPKGWSWCLR
ncbi:MAG: hypothetical protein Q9198_005140 [Flavoplaca austrocitrina]